MILGETVYHEHSVVERYLIEKKVGYDSIEEQALNVFSEVFIKCIDLIVV